ncbi:hypothetical protein RJ40_00170 [Methanofollis aquaemaris]|uniref:CD-NTase-associated protein 12/Pycsar effector protein TIR domain-containing protein n=1 Tax=Methanofollis aquaemaris TaxID=126734 RepID=A0A8A3S303_9EURY|nr:hypothetical protein [Methanofollis aquaemaris]QSZ66026.1 hypothetical protein RJ40_00170 [Methanofollis aquaemaris]
MDISRSLDSQIIAINDLKKSLRIGIFGSFSGENLTLLRTARTFLREHHYHNTYLSIDLKDNPEEKEIDEDVRNLRKSLTLVDMCQVHIFFFFNEHDGEHNLNQSATLELGVLMGRKNRGCPQKSTLIFCENGMDAQCRGLFKGIFAEADDFWRCTEFSFSKNKMIIKNNTMEDIFRPDPEIKFVQTRMKQFCHETLLLWMNQSD